jgi:hypothetical protein
MAKPKFGRILFDGLLQVDGVTAKIRSIAAEAEAQGMMEFAEMLREMAQQNAAAAHAIHAGWDREKKAIESAIRKIKGFL